MSSAKGANGFVRIGTGGGCGGGRGGRRLGVIAAVAGQDRAGSDGQEPVERPGVAWMTCPSDTMREALHRGDLVDTAEVRHTAYD